MCHCDVGLVSRVMARNILMQAAYQLAITLWLVYGGKDAFGITPGYLADHGFNVHVGNVDVLPTEYLNTFIFNSFVMCQVGSSCRGGFLVLGWWSLLYDGRCTMSLMLATLVIKSTSSKACKATTCLRPSSS
jgi:magnesium-transporting ATPase (P-type)